jgi:hypothetical protein
MLVTLFRFASGISRYSSEMLKCYYFENKNTPRLSYTSEINKSLLSLIRR